MRKETNYMVVNERDKNGNCIRKYQNYVKDPVDYTAPAWEIINNPDDKKKSLIGKTYSVPDAEGNIVLLSAAWLIGFFDGEGTITVYINSNSTLTLQFQLQPALVLVQGEADWLLLTAIANFFGCGTVAQNHADKTSVRYQWRIVNMDLLIQLMIPFFTICKLQTKKYNEFLCWKEAVEIINGKIHLQNWPHNIIDLLTLLKNSKKLSFQTINSERYIAQCDRCIELVRTIPATKIEQMRR